MSRVPTVRKADLDRVLASLKAQGLQAATVVVRPGGEVVITPAPAPPSEAGGLTQPPAAGELSDLDVFREQKKKRGLRAPQGT